MDRSPLYDTFARAPIAFERGEGAWLETTDGRRILDFSGGVAVNALGHAHPALVAALTEQAGKLWHVSNLYRIPGAGGARREALPRDASPTRSSSPIPAPRRSSAPSRRRGAITSSAAIPSATRIITFAGAFHGRTLATLAATGNPKYLEGFGPPAEGFDQVPLGDLKAVEAAIGPETAAILIEPIQGEGGVRLVAGQFLRELRALCDKHGLLLDLRRGADRHRPHRQALRLRVVGRRRPTS